jgi:hypothetical protein
MLKPRYVVSAQLSAQSSSGKLMMLTQPSGEMRIALSPFLRGPPGPEGQPYQFTDGDLPSVDEIDASWGSI